jgi:hypothetical protein
MDQPDPMNSGALHNFWTHSQGIAPKPSFLERAKANWQKGTPT